MTLAYTFVLLSQQVFAITHHPENEINQASYNLINMHLNKYSQTRILAQRHEVAVIPVTLCNFTYKDASSSYLVFGLENKV